MVAIPALWLPILVSAVIVFIASNLLWMALPFWHRRDYSQLPDEKSVIDALEPAESGQYIVPCVNWNKLAPEQRAAMEARPMAFVLVRNPAKFAFGKALAQYFAYAVVVAVFVAYVTGRARGAGTPYLEIFRFAGTVGFLPYGFRSVTDSIWYGKPWGVTVKEMIDGLLYGLLMGGVFGWLWPR
jgi:hypothetical protein